MIKKLRFYILNRIASRRLLKGDIVGYNEVIARMRRLIRN